MKRTAFDEHRDQQVANDYQGAHGNCRSCGATAERETLSQYGAMCGRCFTLYCTGGKPNPPMPSKESRIATLQRIKGLCAGNGDTRAWAQGLKAREQGGEVLSKAQRDAWRVVLPEVAA